MMKLDSTSPFNSSSGHFWCGYMRSNGNNKPVGNRSFVIFSKGEIVDIKPLANIKCVNHCVTAAIFYSSSCSTCTAKSPERPSSSWHSPWCLSDCLHICRTRHFSCATDASAGQFGCLVCSVRHEERVTFAGRVAVTFSFLCDGLWPGPQQNLCLSLVECWSRTEPTDFYHLTLHSILASFSSLCCCSCLKTSACWGFQIKTLVLSIWKLVLLFQYLFPWDKMLLQSSELPCFGSWPLKMKQILRTANLHHMIHSWSRGVFTSVGTFSSSYNLFW